MKRTLLALILVFIITGVVLLVAAVYVDDAIGNQHLESGLIIWAKELSEEPQSYFTVTNPDSYVLQILSNPGSSVSLEYGDSQTYNEISAHNSTKYGNEANVEFNDHYYTISRGYWDKGTPLPAMVPVLTPILKPYAIIWVASLIATVIIYVVKFIGHRRVKVTWA